jgi:hypothetical protein
MSDSWSVLFYRIDSLPRYLSAIRKGEPYYTDSPYKKREFRSVKAAEKAARAATRWMGMAGGTHHVVANQ